MGARTRHVCGMKGVAVEVVEVRVVALRWRPPHWMSVNGEGVGVVMICRRDVLATVVNWHEKIVEEKSAP